MMPSRALPPILEVRSSSLALPSGLRTALLKSKNASAAKVTFSLVGAGTTITAGAGVGAAAGAGAGAGGGGAATTGFSAPSQSWFAVAGVQLLSRQHSSFVPFFHGRPPTLFTQLSAVWANAPDI